jgi:hypothetical protein
MRDRHCAYQNEIASFVFGVTAKNFSHVVLLHRADRRFLAGLTTVLHTFTRRKPTVHINQQAEEAVAQVEWCEKKMSFERKRYRALRDLAASEEWLDGNVNPMSKGEHSTGRS